ncbi:hypothetical protein ACP5WH_04830 [Enterocloster bolteae]
MFGSPFLVGLSFLILNGDADLPQHLLIDLADGCSQRPDGGRGVEIEDWHKVLVGEILLRGQPAAGHKGIGDADGGGGFELDLDVKFIILFQKGTVNDVEEVPPMVRPVFPGQLAGNFRQLPAQIAAAHFIAVFQHSGNGVYMPFLQLPQARGAGVGPGAGIGNVKDIPQAGVIPGIVYQGDAFGAAPDIAAHLVVPQAVLGAGGGVRALGVDQHLVVEGIFIEPGGGV